MTVGNDATLFQLQNALGTDNGDRCGTVQITGFTYGRLDLQYIGIGHGNFNLTALAERTEHAHALNGTHRRTDQRQLFFAGILSGLRKILDRGQLIAGTKQRFQILLGQMNMSVGDTDRNFHICGICRRGVKIGQHLSHDRGDLLTCKCHSFILVSLISSNLKSENHRRRSIKCVYTSASGDLPFGCRGAGGLPPAKGKGETSGSTLPLKCTVLAQT